MLEYYSTENSREQRISPLENQKKSPIFFVRTPYVVAWDSFSPNADGEDNILGYSFAAGNSSHPRWSRKIPAADVNYRLAAQVSSSPSCLPL
jgi:hypothetical protein